MKKTFITIITLLFALGINAQTFEWAKSFGGNSLDYGRSVAVDALGNVYTTGYFVGTVDFDPGAGTTNLSSRGVNDIFVQKMDASGNFIWVKSFGSSSNDYGYSITVDDSGNVYTTGFFNGIIDFNPGTGTANLSSAGGLDVFVQKLDASGNFVWAKSFGSIGDDFGISIAVDTFGSVYTVGNFGGTVDFDPGAGTTNLSSVGRADIFVQKLDATGNFAWAKSFGSSSLSSLDVVNSITVDITGNVYIIGSFEGTVDFNPGLGITNLSSSGSDDIFVQKLDASGSFLWAKSFGGSSFDVGYSIAIDATGNVYTTGLFSGTVDFDPGAGIANLSSVRGRDIFVQKLDTSGSFVWAKSFGGIGDNVGHSVSVDTLGNVYTTGLFSGTVDFNPGVGTVNLTSLGPADVFVQKLDTSGNFLWATSFGGIGSDIGYSVKIDASGNVYTTGFFEGTVDFDPSAGTANRTSVGGADIFVQKMSQSITTEIIEIENGIQLSAYPNPSSGLVNVQFTKPLKQAEFIVTDAQGKDIYSKQLDGFSNKQIYIDGPSGIYFLKIKTATCQSMIKLIKE